jgi:phosphoribosylformylglycinamidine synthase
LENLKARIHITLKAGILDAQGKTILHALDMLGFANITAARTGKLVELTFEGVSRARAQELAEAACQKLLANPVIEDYTCKIVDD